MTRTTVWSVKKEDGQYMAYPDHIPHNTTFESVSYENAIKLVEYWEEQCPFDTFYIEGERL